MSDQIKSSLDSIPLIERVTNLRSVLLILVLMLWVDLSLVAVTKTNLLTHPWQESKQQIHYGWVAVLSGVFLAWYVVLIPAVNALIQRWSDYLSYCFRKWLIDPFVANGEEEPGSLRYHMAHKEMPASSLWRWGIDHSDELAIRLATEKLQKSKEVEQSRANVNQAAFAFMLLVLADSLWPGSLFQAYVWPLASTSNTLGVGILCVLLGFLLAIATSWWLTRPFQRTDSYVYYPKAVHDDSRKRP